MPTPIVDHAYAQAGTYTVTLTVTDFQGLSATASAQVKVGTPPVANAGGPYSGTSGVPVTLNGSASSDPTGQPLTYFWYFGDGATGTGVSPSHTYVTAETYSVSLVVENASGIVSTLSYASATIVVPPPVVTINGPYTGEPTLPVTFAEMWWSCTTATSPTCGASGTARRPPCRTRCMSTPRQERIP